MTQRIGLMYGSTTMNSERVAELIWNKMQETELHDIQDGVEVLEQYEHIILVAPTWDYGALQEHYIEHWDNLQNVNWTNKSVALVGLGDQVGYGELYQDALAEIYNVLEPLGAKFVGFTSTQGHNYKKSKAVIDNKFIGLAIDEDCQRDMTENRLNSWIEEIRSSWSET
tara:strand:+ start:2232 stop:2738 length:507 start_codon:yes stop_codon:yes gene_type:complete